MGKTIKSFIIELLNCRLCWKVTTALFIGIVFIEGIILIPSYISYERDEIKRIELSALASIQTLLKNSDPDEYQNKFTILPVVSKIVGLEMLDLDKNIILALGETPNIDAPKQSLFRLFNNVRKENGDRFDVYWQPNDTKLPYNFIVRLDTSEIDQLLYSFVFRIIGLVGVIASFITICTMLILRKLVIKPILHLRDMSLLAAEDPIHAKYKIEVDRNDEIGDLFINFNAMLDKISSGLSDAIQHENELADINANLEKTINNRTLELQLSNEKLKKEINEKKKFEHELYNLANYDMDTKLPNKNMLIDKLQTRLDNLQQDALVSIININFLQLQDIINAFSQEVGDDFLRAIAMKIFNEFPIIDSIGRYGQQQLCIFTRVISEQIDQIELYSKLIGCISSPINVLKHKVSSTVLLGIAIFPENGLYAISLCKNAQVAVENSANLTPNSFNFFCKSIQTELQSRNTLLADLHEAIDKQQFHLVYQPKICIASNTIHSAEALIRWNHPQQGYVRPDKFIAIAESSGLITQIGEWVLKTACQQAASWSKTNPNFRIAINLSPIQFQDKNLVSNIKNILNETKLPAASLELEITESALVSDIDNAITIMHQLCDIGIMLAIDDFGTGYSSLSYLKRFPVHKIKIDQSFIKVINPELKNEKMADAIIYLIHSLGFKVVAEGVETKFQADYLASKHCDEAQGYLFGKPMLGDDFIKMIS